MYIIRNFNEKNILRFTRRKKNVNNTSFCKIKFIAKIDINFLDNHTYFKSYKTEEKKKKRTKIASVSFFFLRGRKLQEICYKHYKEKSFFFFILLCVKKNHFSFTYDKRNNNKKVSQ